MKVAVTRCYNEEKNIDRYINGYFWADRIIISDGGSTDQSLAKLESWKNRFPDKIEIRHFEKYEIIKGVRWNPDNPHIQYIIDEAKKFEPDWIILDDLDDVPNYALRQDARFLLEITQYSQLNAFRLYMWGDNSYYPQMNGHFDESYLSLWAWQPRKVDIYADQNEHHGTIKGISNVYDKLLPPYCLLHKSWHPDTIQAKIDKYNAIGIPMNHPKDFAGPLMPLPDYAHE